MVKNTKLTIQQASDFLNVSTEYLIALMDKKQIPSQGSGTHRNVFFQDIEQYKIKMIRKREKVLDELTSLSQDLNLGYE